jgi:hypothetical protein
MHQTTGRFDQDTWKALGLACRRAGISKAQYVRDATVERLARGAYVAEITDLRRDVDHLQAQVSRVLVLRRPR